MDSKHPQDETNNQVQDKHTIAQSMPETPGHTHTGNTPGRGTITGEETTAGECDKITIDIKELESLRDVITYKAKVLRLQERTFKTKEKEHQAVKRALIDFIITMFGYLNVEEAQSLIAKVCKEYNFKVDEIIIQAIAKSNNRLSFMSSTPIPTREGTLTARVEATPNPQNSLIEQHSLMKQASMRSQSQNPQNYYRQESFNNEEKQEGELDQRREKKIRRNADISRDQHNQLEDDPVIKGEESKTHKRGMRIGQQRFQKESHDLRKSYAISSNLGDQEFPQNEFGQVQTRSILKKLNQLQKDIQDLVHQINFEQPTSKIQKRGDLLRFSMSKQKNGALSLSQKSQSLNTSMMNQAQPDNKVKIQDSVILFKDTLEGILKNELQYYDEGINMLDYNRNKDEYLIKISPQRSGLSDPLEDGNQPQALQGSSTARVYSNRRDLTQSVINIQRQLQDDQQLDQLHPSGSVSQSLQFQSSSAQKQGQKNFKSLTTSQNRFDMANIILSDRSEGRNSEQRQLMMQSLKHHEMQKYRSGLRNNLVFKSIESRWESQQDQLERLNEEQDEDQVIGFDQQFEIQNPQRKLPQKRQESFLQRLERLDYEIVQNQDRESKDSQNKSDKNDSSSDDESVLDRREILTTEQVYKLKSQSLRNSLSLQQMSSSQNGDTKSQNISGLIKTPSLRLNLDFLKQQTSSLKNSQTFEFNHQREDPLIQSKRSSQRQGVRILQYEIDENLIAESGRMTNQDPILSSSRRVLQDDDYFNPIDDQDEMFMYQDKAGEDEDNSSQKFNTKRLLSREYQVEEQSEVNLQLQEQSIEPIQKLQQLRYQSSRVSSNYDNDIFEIDQIQRIQFQQVDACLQTDDDLWLNDFLSKDQFEKQLLSNDNNLELNNSLEFENFQFEDIQNIGKQYADSSVNTSLEGEAKCSALQFECLDALEIIQDVTQMRNIDICELQIHLNVLASQNALQLDQSLSEVQIFNKQRNQITMDSLEQQHCVQESVIEINFPIIQRWIDYLSGVSEFNIPSDSRYLDSCIETLKMQIYSNESQRAQLDFEQIDLMSKIEIPQIKREMQQNLIQLVHIIRKDISNVNERSLEFQNLDTNCLTKDSNFKSQDSIQFYSKCRGEPGDNVQEQILDQAIVESNENYGRIHQDCDLQNRVLSFSIIPIWQTKQNYIQSKLQDQEIQTDPKQKHEKLDRLQSEFQKMKSRFSINSLKSAKSKMLKSKDKVQKGQELENSEQEEQLMSTLQSIETKEQARSLLKTLKSKIHEIFGESIEENGRESSSEFYAQKLIEIQNNKGNQEQETDNKKLSKVISYRNTQTIGHDEKSQASNSSTKINQEQDEQYISVHNEIFDSFLETHSSQNEQEHNSKNNRSQQIISNYSQNKSLLKSQKSTDSLEQKAKMLEQKNEIKNIDEQIQTDDDNSRRNLQIEALSESLQIVQQSHQLANLDYQKIVCIDLGPKQTELYLDTYQSQYQIQSSNSYLMSINQQNNMELSILPIKHVMSSVGTQAERARTKDKSIETHQKENKLSLYSMPIISLPSKAKRDIESQVQQNLTLDKTFEYENAFSVHIPRIYTQKQIQDERAISEEQVIIKKKPRNKVQSYQVIAEEPDFSSLNFENEKTDSQDFIENDRELIIVIEDLVSICREKLQTKGSQSQIENNGYQVKIPEKESQTQDAECKCEDQDSSLKDEYEKMESRVFLDSLTKRFQQISERISNFDRIQNDFGVLEKELVYGQNIYLSSDDSSADEIEDEVQLIISDLEDIEESEDTQIIGTYAQETEKMNLIMHQIQTFDIKQIIMPFRNLDIVSNQSAHEIKLKETFIQLGQLNLDMKLISIIQKQRDLVLDNLIKSGIELKLTSKDANAIAQDLEIASISIEKVETLDRSTLGLKNSDFNLDQQELSLENIQITENDTQKNHEKDLLRLDSAVAGQSVKSASSSKSLQFNGYVASFDLRKCVCDKTTQYSQKESETSSLEKQKTQEIPQKVMIDKFTSTQIDVKDSMHQLFLQTKLSQTSMNIVDIIKKKQQEAIAAHFKKTFKFGGTGQMQNEEEKALAQGSFLGSSQRKRGITNSKDQDIIESQDDASQNSSNDLIPPQLTRYMTFKRDRCYTVFCDEEYVFVDGLNNDIDVFSTEDFRFIATISSSQNNLIAGHSQNGRFYLACQNKNLLVCSGRFQRLAHIKLKQNAYSLVKYSKDLILIGERRGFVEVFSTKENEIVQTFQLKEVSHIIQMQCVSETNKEYAIASNNGLYFLSILDKEYQEEQFMESLGDAMRFTQSEESYFIDKHIRGVVLYDSQHQSESQSSRLIVSLDEDSFLYLIDRKLRQVIRKVSFGESLGPICIRKFISPNEQNEFILVRDEQGVTLVDFEEEKHKQLIQSVNLMAPFPQQQLELIDRSWEEDGLIQLMLIEYSETGTGARQSVLKRFDLNQNFLSAAIHLEINFD